MFVCLFCPLLRLTVGAILGGPSSNLLSARLLSIGSCHACTALILDYGMGSFAVAWKGLGGWQKDCLLSAAVGLSAMWG